MKTLEDIQQLLSANRDWIRHHYHVTSLGIFGSYARGEQTALSDVDVLFDYEQAPTLIQVFEFRRYLSDLIGMEVDVVSKNGLKPRIRERVLSEVIYL